MKIAILGCALLLVIAAGYAQPVRDELDELATLLKRYIEKRSWNQIVQMFIKNGDSAIDKILIKSKTTYAPLNMKDDTYLEIGIAFNTLYKAYGKHPVTYPDLKANGITIAGVHYSFERLFDDPKILIIKSTTNGAIMFGESAVLDVYIVVHCKADAELPSCANDYLNALDEIDDMAQSK